MIGIDIKMPKACMCCELECWASGYGNRCSATFAETTYIRAKSRHPDCPLHPLDDEIHVGDEVCFEDGESFKAVVLDAVSVNGLWCVLTENGCISIFDEKNIHRTGRHFDEVETMLKKMRGEDDG